MRAMTDGTIITPLADLEHGLQTIVGDLATDAGLSASAPRVELERPREEKFGDFASNIAMMLAPIMRVNPRQVGEQVAARLADRDDVSKVDVAGPGFINITMHDRWFLDLLARVLEAGDRWGADSVDTTEHILLEFVSANPTGPLVAASARHAAYGDALARILRHAGHDVDTEFYVNDAGRQIERFGASILARATGGDIPDEGYQGEYVRELAESLHATAGDDPDDLGQRGVAMMVERIRGDLSRLGVTFDRFQSERELHDGGLVDAAIERVQGSGHTYEQDGALFLRTTTWNDDRDRAIRRATGVPTYFAADLAYLQHKRDRIDHSRGRLIYVLGADHHGYIARLKGGATALGHDADTTEVVILQMVSLMESGEQKKMSKRRGDFVTAAELLDRIGPDATRFFMLQRSHDQSFDLDLDLAQQQADTNPVFYVQYAHARLCAIMRKAEQEGFDTSITASLAALADDAVSQAAGDLHASTRHLIKRVAEFPLVVAAAAQRRQPHRMTHYLHDLASDVSRFYRDCRVTGDGVSTESTLRRLATVHAARIVLAAGLDLLGVSAPERM